MTLSGESDRIAHWIEQHSPTPLKLSDAQRHSNGSMFLTLGTNELWWSLNSGTRKTGWLMFWQPFSTNAVWEFARCAKTNLADVGPSELDASFAGIKDSRGEVLFAADWATNAIRVTQGEIVLARRVGQVQPIYVILLKRHAADDFGRTEIEYLVVPTKRRPNQPTQRMSGDEISLKFGCLGTPLIGDLRR